MSSILIEVGTKGFLVCKTLVSIQLTTNKTHWLKGWKASPQKNKKANDYLEPIEFA